MTRVLIMLMVVQSLLGLLLPEHYRDVEWIRATWYGNDWVTLVVATPLLWLGNVHAARGSVRGVLLSLGLAGYAVYNYAFYIFGAALNVFFPLYVSNVLVGAAALGLLLSRLDVAAVPSSFRPDTPVRLIGSYLILVAAGLATVWLAIWAGYAFAGRPTPVEPEAFKVVAALDLLVIVPALSAGGALLWKRRGWGYVIATVAAVQGALYLLVLLVNSVIAISRGLAPAPGELGIWGPLALCTTIAAVILLRSASPARPGSGTPASHS